MQRLLVILLAASLLIPSTLRAVEQPAVPTEGKSKKTAEPDASAPKTPLKLTGATSDMVEVEADKLDVYKNKGEAFFQGNVKATRADMLLKSTTLRLFYDTATKKVKQMTADGDVFIRWQDKDATCRQATYLFNEKKMILTGDVVMVRGEERITGERVIMDMASDHQIVEGGRKGRVKIKVKTGQGTEVPW